MITPILLLLQIAFFSVARAVFLLWNWQSFHTASAGDLLYAFLQGVRFDLSAACMVGSVAFLLELVFRRRFLLAVTVLFVLMQMPGMIFTLGDAEFVNFTGRRMSVDALFNFRELPGKFTQIVLNFWGLSVISCAVIAAYLVLIRKIHQSPYRMRWDWRWVSLVFVLIFIGARGGLQRKPLGFAHAQIFASPLMNNLVMNSTFTFLQTIKREALPRSKYFDDRKEMLALLPGSLPGVSSITNKRFSSPQNIVLIILESFNFDYMGKPFGDKGYTPFLDTLADRGIFFRNHYANARRSIEGIGAILGGIPAWMNEPFLSSQYMANYFLGIGNLLTAKGYQTSFFHGGQNGTMYFDSFMKSVGMQNYFGATEYGNTADFDGTWGIYDGPFLKWSAAKMTKFERPFFSAIFTLSSHNPYKLPVGMEDRFPKGNLDILASIGYTDHSLLEFFADAEKQDWFENTLFIITADHTYKSSRPALDNEVGQHRIPLILYHPQWEKNAALKPRVDEEQVTSQIDILPTILDFVDAETPERNYLSRSVFVPGDRFAVSFVDGKYHLYAKEYFLTLSRDQEFRLYSGSDSFERTPLTEPAAVKEELTRKLKASIQYFSEGLWDNKLYYPNSR